MKSTPLPQKSNESTISGSRLPQHVQEALTDWLSADSDAKCHHWIVSAKSYAVEQAVEKDKKVAAKENRKPVRLGELESKYLPKESRSSFVDGRLAWGALMLAGLEEGDLPERSHWAFVRLGRLRQAQEKRIRREGTDPGSIEKEVKSLRREIIKAAKAFAGGDRHAIDAVAKRFKPPKPSPPITDQTPPDVRFLGYVDLSMFTAQLQALYPDANGVRSAIGIMAVTIREMTPQALANAAANAEVHNALARVAPKHGGDMWVCYSAKAVPATTTKSEAQNESV